MKEIDFVVTDELKKLQKKEMEIYLFFRDFCQNHGLRFFAVGGTALGAARHQGFIPWDDDMDFGMPHEDYQRFLELGAKEFSYPYYLSSHVTDPLYGGITNSRIRRLDTTACSKWEYDNHVATGDKNYKLGVWIDIFPLSYVPEDEETRRIQKEQIMDVWKAIRGYSALLAIEEGRDNYNRDYIAFIDIYKRYREKYTLGEMKQLYLDLCGQNKAPTKYIGATSFRTFAPHLIWETEWFEHTVELPFDGITVTAPVGYEQMLTKQYGDWHTPVRNAAYHEMFIFDTEVPYLEKSGLYPE